MPSLSEFEARNYKILLANQAEYEKRIAKTMLDSLDSVRAELSKIFEKYAKDGKLSKTDMMQYGRLSSLEKNLMTKIDPAIKSTIKELKRLPAQFYAESYFHEGWAIDQAAELNLGWGVINTDSVRAVLDNTFFQDALSSYRPNFLKALRGALATGLPQGISYTDMMKNITKVFNISAYEAMRILRTEGQAALNAGASDAYLRAKEKGIELDEIWDATLDGSTRPTHQAADGTTKGKDGYFRVGGYPALYPCWEGLPAKERVQCRCRSRAEISGYSPLLRRSKEDGVIPYQTYFDWAAGNVKYYKARRK
jgi:hypothetical protein